MPSLQLSDDEREWLARTHPYFKDDYLNFLAAYRYEPAEIRLIFRPQGTTSPQQSFGNEHEDFQGDPSEHGDLEVEITGLWSRTILWEVPLMSALSQSYFETVDVDWDYSGQEELAYHKAKRLLLAGCMFSDFGSRRRRTLYSHHLVIKGLTKAQSEVGGYCKGHLVGTSNVHLAYKYGLKTSGTIAHEWFMGIACLKGYKNTASHALAIWEAEYAPNLLTTLTDTFSTEVFYKDFILDPERVRRWQGLRQDSGDPFVFAPRAKEIYQQLNIDHTSKTIIYSDALDVDRCIELRAHCQEVGFKPAFGIGTNLSNDYTTKSSHGKEKSVHLNMVVKLSSIEGRQCVKISDDLNKNTGDAESVKYVKGLLGILGMK